MTDPIKTRPDGSINTAHYIRLGRMARSQAAHDMARAALPKPSPRGGNRRSWLVPLMILSVVVLTVPFVA